MGIEGMRRKHYFESFFSQMILRNESVFVFDGRTRRPPLDPVNAMLSFSYTFAWETRLQVWKRWGLDPAVDTFIRCVLGERR